MDTDKIEQAMKKVIGRDNYGDEVGPYFHPSQVTGCPLKVTLDKLTDQSVTLNSWLFQGSAVHHYLQETGMMDEIMLEAGYDIFSSDYEISTQTHIGDGVYLTGKCDILTHGPEGRTVFDIKYSSIPVESGHGRLFKYFSQANVYAHMFDADEYGLMVISSKSQDLLNDINVLSGEKNEDNWEIVKKKTKQIHELLEHENFYDGVRWNEEELSPNNSETWEDMLGVLDKKDIPSYEKECQYCDHKQYCPVKQGTLNSGLDSFRNGV